MFKKILTILLSLPLALAVSAQLTFSGSGYKVVADLPEAATGLNHIYVLFNTQGVEAKYTATSSGTLRWLKYSNLGGGYAQEVATTRNGNTYSITLGADDMGYIIEDGTKRYYCWVVNYANHYCRLNSLTLADEQDCDRTRLQFSGTADKITYYTINGVGKELSRDLRISYNTLAYDDATEFYQQVEATQVFASIEQSIGVPAPLCDTRFVLTGDRFLQAWAMEAEVESPNYNTIAVEAQTKAEQTTRENDNEQKIEGGALGGSAPVDVKFTAAVTDAAIFREWQMSRDAQFDEVLDRFQQLEFEYSFRENGNFFVRFVANNAAGSCEYLGETYEVFVGESDLQCPNIFTPNGDGVNDEWKVSYKSIIEFECHIFNRWGQEMCSFTDPARGWDGRYGGKYVPTGVYYYVIRAKGSDGRKYKLSGDINIIKSKRNSTSATEE